jgi:hypothetical protein
MKERSDQSAFTGQLRVRQVLTLPPTLELSDLSLNFKGSYRS